MSTYAIMTKYNGVNRQVEPEVARRAAPGNRSVTLCDARGCAEVLLYHSTDGFCIQHWTLAKTQHVTRKIGRTAQK